MTEYTLGIKYRTEFKDNEDYRGYLDSLEAALIARTEERIKAQLAKGLKEKKQKKLKR